MPPSGRCDEAFYVIHPRALAVTDKDGGRPTNPTWLRDLRARHLLKGSYREEDGSALVPRGPLLRAPRARFASSGDSVADRLAAVSVVPTALRQEDRVVPVSTVVFERAKIGRTRSPPGEEQVGLVPVASSAGQLSAEPVARGTGVFANYGPAPGFAADESAAEAIAHLGDADVVIMPELVFDESHVEKLLAALAAGPGPRPRLVVAGSCRTDSLRDSMPWNECRVVTG